MSNMGSKEKDHEVSMAKSQVRNSIINLKRVQKVLSTMSDDDNLPAWLQAKITDTEHNTDAAAGYMSEGKSKCGEGEYWCKTDEKCKEDPNPNRKGKAKNVRQESYSNWREELQEQEKYGILTGQGTKFKDPDDAIKKMVPGAVVVPSTPKKSANVRNAHFEPEGELVEYADGGGQIGKGSVMAGPKAGEFVEKLPGRIRRALKKVKPGFTIKGNEIQINSYQPEGELVDEGKKDACYKKVKASEKVWPSAYASGRLVQCRKKGAANYGKSKKNEEYDTSNWKDDFQPLNVETVNIIEPEPIKGGQKIDEKCWDGYTQKGMKKKGKRLVPNCVKEKYSNWREELAESGYDSTYGRGEMGEPKGTQYPKVNKDKFNKDMKWWRENLKNASPVKQASTEKTNQVAHFEPEGEIIEGAAWTKKSGKNPKGGLNEKGRKSYERENPGSDLKRPSKKKGNKRRKSFCARMKGMKKKLTSKKTANDPDSRINKSLRAWNC